MTKHRWKERTEEGLRHYLATVHGGRWTFSSMLDEDEDWTHHEQDEVEILLSTREMLWRKYQRKRIPWKSIEQVDKLIIKAGGTPPGETGEK